MKKRILTYLFCGLFIMMLPLPAAAQEPDERPFFPGRDWFGGGHGPGGRGPYGAYCPKRHPDKYGAQQPVRTETDARERLLQFFGVNEVSIANLVERPRHFRADILDKQGKLLDTVIIDRRSGRIRSIL